MVPTLGNSSYAMDVVIPTGYFESSWAIMSTIGLVNLFYGLMILSIIGWAPVCLVPVIVSGSGALANGLCYVAFYGHYSITSRAVASAFADMAWLIEEAGLSFYSFIILRRILENYRRAVFMAIFWTMILVVAVSKLSILALRVQFILGSMQSTRLPRIIDHLHTGYFIGIAIVECVSAFFLLTHVGSVKKRSEAVMVQRQSLFGYLTRTTELRLALLALLGVLRTITYNFQHTANGSAPFMNQLDRFAATLEILFPGMMYIDVLASRLVFARTLNSRRFYTTSMATFNPAATHESSLSNMKTKRDCVVHVEHCSHTYHKGMSGQNHDSGFSSSPTLPAATLQPCSRNRSSGSLIRLVDPEAVQPR